MKVKVIFCVLVQNLSKYIHELYPKDQLLDSLPYLPLDKNCLKKACEFWAEMRIKGTPTADPKALDGDVILAAQATLIGGIVVTDNIKHLDRMVHSIKWEQL